MEIPRERLRTIAEIFPRCNSMEKLQPKSSHEKRMLISNLVASGAILLKPNINSVACAPAANNYEDIQSTICKLMRAIVKTTN